jgi:hypothetical protein
MSLVADAFVVLASVLGSGLVGLSLRSVIPEQHLHEESLGMVRLCAGVLATLAALYSDFWLPRRSRTTIA